MSVKNFFTPQNVPIQQVQYSDFRFDILRLDQIHSGASGNKFFKLKYNFVEAEKQGYKKVLTFGGAFSNHIVATAISANACGFRSIGIIRGEEVQNPTLAIAKENGMKLYFEDRASYRNKDTPAYIDKLKRKFPDFYIIPEGGTNTAAVAGTAEIHDFIPDKYTYIATCFGSGGTLAGLINGKSKHQKIIGFSVLRGEWVQEELRGLTAGEDNSWVLSTEYHFGGYAKWKPELIEFIKEFYKTTGIPLDPIYTGKMIYGLLMECMKSNIPHQHKKVLAIHSGGLQGIQGFNERFGFDLPTF